MHSIGEYKNLAVLVWGRSSAPCSNILTGAGRQCAPRVCCRVPLFLPPILQARRNQSSRLDGKPATMSAARGRRSPCNGSGATSLDARRWSLPFSWAFRAFFWSSAVLVKEHSTRQNGPMRAALAGDRLARRISTNLVELFMHYSDRRFIEPVAPFSA
jgi:hypothetical protein